MDYVQALEQAMGSEANLDLLPMQPGDVLATAADVSRLVEDFGYRPKGAVGEGGAWRHPGLRPGSQAGWQWGVREVPQRGACARVRGVRCTRIGDRGPLHEEVGGGNNPAAVQLRGQGRPQGCTKTRDDTFSGTHGHGQVGCPPTPHQVVLNPPVLALREDPEGPWPGALPV